MLFCKKGCKMEAKRRQKAPKASPRKQKRSQPGQKVAKRSPREPLRTKSVSDVALGGSTGVFRVPFWRHLADFGCHLGPSWAPTGVPKSHFWRQVRQKVEKSDTNKRCRKLHEFLIESGCQNGRLGEAKSLKIHTLFKVW